MKYSIRLFKGFTQYTAYRGASISRAKDAVEVLRATLIMTGGTATICVSYDEGYNLPVWEVVNGAATAHQEVK
jgi:hypothetical protein